MYLTRTTQQAWWERVSSGRTRAVAFLRKDLTIALSYRLQFIFQFSQVFFSVMLIYFLGRMVSASGGSGVLAAYGADYFSFALVGLAVNSYPKTGLITMTNELRQMMNQGVFEALCAGPVEYKWLLLYTSLWPFLFETVRVGFYFLLGVVVKKGDPINWIFSSLSGLLAGTMFPVAVLPKWLQAAAFCLPLTHALEALRRCLLTGSSLGDVRRHLLALAVFAAVLLPITIVTSNFCLARARRSGAFSTH